MSVYERSGTTLNKLANPAALPTGNGYGCSFGALNGYLAVAHDISPFVTVYKNYAYEPSTQFAAPAITAIGAAAKAYIKALP